MKTRQERAALRKSQDREIGLAFASSYFAIEQPACSAFEWFVLKSGNDVKLARRRWKAIDMDDLLHERAVAASARKIDNDEIPF